MVAAVADLKDEILTADFANSLRAGTNALRSAFDAVKSGSAKEVMVTAADCRLGYPKTTDEQNFGDAAAALLIGDSDVIAEIEGVYSISNEMVDVWRTDREDFVHSWEARFVTTHGYTENMRKAISGIMKKYELAPKDFAKVVLYAPDARSHRDLAREMGFDLKAQVQDPLLTTVGNAGVAHSLMVLVSALEEAKAGDRILLVSYGDGADAFILRATEGIENAKDGRGVKGYIESKKILPNYGDYLLYRGLLEQPFELFNVDSAATTLWRDRNWALRGHGSKCRRCGTTSFPIERVCYGCQAKDDFEEVRLSDKKAKVFTFSRDRLAGSSAAPYVVQTVAESEEGAARIYAMMIDCDPEEVKIDMPVKMTFRRIREARGFYNYFWKLRPLRKRE
jgi:3-hydroxy-3-methylglutaryl CoA synthase